MQEALDEEENVPVSNATSSAEVASDLVEPNPMLSATKILSTTPFMNVDDVNPSTLDVDTLVDDITDDSQGLTNNTLPPPPRGNTVLISSIIVIIGSTSQSVDDNAMYSASAVLRAISVCNELRQ